MIPERMLELILLNQLNYYVRDLSASEYDDFCNQHDMNKIRERSEELTDEFLEKYVIDKNVTV